MLIYFEEDETAINTENVSSIEYLTYDSRPCLYFEVNGKMKDVAIFFPTKDDALKVLDIILTTYNSYPQKVVVIHNKNMVG